MFKTRSEAGMLGSQNTMSVLFLIAGRLIVLPVHTECPVFN